MLRLASIIADVLQEYFCVITVACGLVCRGASQWRCTRYAALHPNRRGVMPTVRVHCPLGQVKVWSVCAEVTVSHRGRAASHSIHSPLFVSLVIHRG